MRLGVRSEADVDRLTDDIAEGRASEADIAMALAPEVAAAAAAAPVRVATATASEFKALIGKVEGADPDDVRDVGGSVKAHVFQAAAMLSYWCTELRVDYAFEEGLGLGGALRALYRNMSKPVAEATIAKGANLTNEEFASVLGGGKGGKGGKGGGKGKKGRGGRGGARSAW